MPNPSEVLTGTVDAAAAGADSYVDIVAPYDGTVTAAAFVPTADITGADTNSRTVKVVNRGQAGSGTTQVAILALASGVNAVATHEEALPLSSTPADLVVAAGDVLRVTSLHVGTGLAAPQLDARIRFDQVPLKDTASEAPLTDVQAAVIDPADTAVDNGGAFVEAPWAGTVTAAAVIADAAVTGADTNSRTVRLVKGDGTVVASLAFVTGVDAVVDVETPLALSEVAGATAVTGGEVLEFESVHVGTGLAAPKFEGRVTFTRA